VKPAHADNGMGIKILDNLQEILDYVDSDEIRTCNVKFTIDTPLVIVQKYIEKPLLFKDKRKFDIRVWVALTGKGECYFYNDGYIRTSSKAYKVDDEDLMIHLTNLGQQKFKE